MPELAPTQPRAVQYVRWTETTPFQKSCQLACADFGPSDGYPVVVCHGTLGSLEMPGPDDSPDRVSGVISLDTIPGWTTDDHPANAPGILERLGVRLIFFDRDQCGESNAHCVEDTPLNTPKHVARILGHLGIEGRFSVVGFSAGGAHALACAADNELGKRVDCVVTSGSLSPGGLAASSRGELSDHNREAGAMDFMGVMFRSHDTVNEVEEDPRIFLNKLYKDMGYTDVLLLMASDRRLERAILRSYARSVRRGAYGHLLDVATNVSGRWGFKLSKVTAPTLVIQGTADKFTPQECAQDLAKGIAGPSEVIYVQGAGHFIGYALWNYILRRIVTGDMPGRR